MAIKSKELAGLLGVSTATMSLVLNQKPGISDELRNTLLERIREMGYGYMIKDMPEEGLHPEALESKTIAYVILSEYQDEADEAAFFPPVIEGAEREARHLGYHFSMMHVYEEKGQSLKEAIGTAQYAGMIVYANALSEGQKQALDETEIPYVLLDCYDPLLRVSSVTVNNRQGIETALRYLYDKGHRKIGYVSSGRPHFSLMERLRSFREVMGELGLWKDEEEHIITCGTGQRDVVYLEERWREQGCPFTALVAENDVLAVVVYQALKGIGYRIPEDVSVIGFDGRSICSMLKPTLTTMRIPRRLMGRMLVMLLRNKLELKKRSLEDVPVRVEVNAELVKMESTAEAKDPAEGIGTAINNL